MGEIILLYSENKNKVIIYQKEGLEKETNMVEIIKAFKLYDNLQNHILVLTEELASSPSTQLRYLLEEFIRIRDE